MTKQRYIAIRSIFCVLLFIGAAFVAPNATAQIGGNGTHNDLYNKTQNNSSNRYDPKNPLANTYGIETTPDSIGGKKERKPRKPIETYLFSDSIKARNVFSWRHNPYNNNVEIIDIDTMLTDFQKDYLFFNTGNSVGAAYLGNLAGAAMPLNYFERKSSAPFTFLDGYSNYLYTPETAKFFNARRPFSQLSFFMSGQSKRAEEQLRVLHSQNISPSSSFNLDYRNNGTRGMYNNQRSKDKNLSLAFAHTGKRYSIHGGYIYNMGNMQENGGIIDDREVKDTLIDLPQNILINLKDARNTFKGNTFYFTQTYGLPLVKPDSATKETLADVPAVFLGNSFEFTKYKKVYTDTRLQSYDTYYQNWYINPNQTNDSLSQHLMDLRFFAQVQPYNRNGVFGTIDGGVGFKNESFYNFTMEDYLNSSTKANKKNSLYVYAHAGGQLQKYMKWSGRFKYTPIGYRNQDLEIGGSLEFTANVKKKPLSLFLDFQYGMNTPSYWTENYFSNHYAWDNSFKKENETRFSATLRVNSIGLEAGVTQSLLNNKIYWNAASLPAQSSGALSLTGVFLRKDFRLGGLHLNNRVLLQLTSASEVVPVPLVSANATYFYEFNVVKNVLRLQIGLDCFYNTDYYGPGYNPALMQFYNQQSVKTGNYIWMDAFVSGKWKRLRFLVKMQHLNYELFGGRDYFQVAHYPLNRRMLKLGVSWNFYD